MDVILLGNELLEGKKLFFFVGVSGSGKDSIMNGVMEALKERGKKVYFVERWITREAHASEPFIPVTKEEFIEKAKENGFVLSWFVYDKNYGIPIEIEEYLKNDFYVFINVSRAILFKGKERYPKSKIVFIKVSNKIAEDRIKKRKREDAEGAKERYKRMKAEIKIPDPDLIVVNEGKLETTIKRVIDYIKP